MRQYAVNCTFFIQSCDGDDVFLKQGMSSYHFSGMFSDTPACLVVAHVFTTNKTQQMGRDEIEHGEVLLDTTDFLIEAQKERRDC